MREKSDIVASRPSAIQIVERRPRTSQNGHSPLAVTVDAVSDNQPQLDTVPGVEPTAVVSARDERHEARPSDHRSIEDIFGRAIDIAGAAVGLLVFAPLMLLISAAIKLTSRGPVFFVHNRLGRGGKQFRCLKFRTMVADAETILHTRADLKRRYEEQGFKIKDDPRVTRVGAVLRRLSLDELPQFINVLRGEMALIGPRPIVPREIARYGDSGTKLLTVRPGMGGAWQVQGRSDTTYEERIAMDMEYIDRRSVVLDAKLILQTLCAVFRRRGAY